MIRSWIAASAVMLCLAAAPISAKERVMVGDDIYVGPDEELDEVVCVMCSIRIDGRVREAVAIMGGIRVDGEVERDVAAIMGGARINGRVGGDAVAVIGGVNISGAVEGDAVAVIGGLNLEDGASVGGDTVAVIGGMTRSPSSTIGGEVAEVGDFAPFAIGLMVVALIVGLVVALALGPILSAVTLAIAGDRRIEIVRDTLNQRLGMCFLIGLGVFVGGSILSVILQMVLFWAPGIEVPIGLAMFVVSVVGYTGLSLWVGRGLVKTGGAMGATVLGSILVTFVQLIPFIGWFLLWPIFSLLALGAATISGFGTSVDWLMRRAETEPIARPLPR